MAIVTVQKPDSLSMSGNLKELILQSADPVAVTLKVEGAIVLVETYYPGNGNLVRVAFDEVIKSFLTFKLPSSDVYIQPDLAKDFSINYGGEEYTFRCVRSGKLHLDETPTQFLRGNFLTWQPTQKAVTYYSPEWLTYYATEACTVRVRAYWEDGTNSVISLSSPAAGICVTYNLQYAVVSGKFSGKSPMYYDVWVDNTSGVRLSYVQRYIASEQQSEDENWYLFENSLGGLDSLRAYGALRDDPEYTHNIAIFGDNSEEYRVDTSRLQTRNTGLLTPEESRWLQDMFVAPRKYVYTLSGVYHIVFTSSDAKTDTSKPSESYTFTYRLADGRPYLDIQRRTDLPDKLVIPIPSGETFFLPPRLAEFPKPTLSADLLIPVQEPHSEVWGTTTAGVLKDAVLNELVNKLEGVEMNPSPGGGSGSVAIIKADDLTTPSDGNVFSSLRSLKEIEQAIDAMELDLQQMFLRRDVDDRAQGNISFVKEINSAVFLDGMDGKGWRIKQNGSALLDSAVVRSDVFVGNKIGSPSFAPGFAGWGTEIDIPSATGTFDNIFARKTFTAYEIVYSQIYGVGGNQVVSDLNKIAAVERLPDRWRCSMDDMDGLMLMNLRAGDGIRIQTRTGLTSTRYMFGRCIAVSNDYFDIAYPLIEGYGEPETGDFAMRWGNDRDTTRQGLIYLTSSDQGAPYIAVYDGITGVSTQDKLKAQLGNLSMIRTRRGTRLKGYGAYLDGAFIENSSIVLESGMTVEQQFSVMNGELNSKIEGVRNDMSVEDGNLLKNSSFALNLDYWVSSDTVRFVDVEDGNILWMDGSFYTEKNRVADIYRDGNKNVLRILNSGISQSNKRISGDKKAGLYSIAFYYKVIRAGILTAGFPMKPLYLSEVKPVSDQYLKQSLVARWDGTGDFMLGFTGEILIYGVSLFDDALANARIELETQIFQNAEQIKLSATKKYVDEETGSIYKKYNSELSVMAGEIAARVTETRFNAETGKIREEVSSGFSVQAGQISAVSTRVDNVNKTIETAGWINSAQGNLLYASQNGDEIISYINQTATTTTISSSRINLIGAVSFNMFDTSLAKEIDGKPNASELREFALVGGDTLISKSDLGHDLQKEINAKLTGSSESSGNKLAKVIINGHTLIAGGYVQADLINADEIWCTSLAAVRGRIGGFIINGQVLANEDGRAGISIKYSNDRYVTVNPEDGYALISLKQNNGVALNSESYLSDGISIRAYASQLATSIHSTGKCYFGLGGGEKFHLDLHNRRDGGYADVLIEGVQDAGGNYPPVSGRLRYHYNGSIYSLIVVP